MVHGPMMAVGGDHLLDGDKAIAAFLSKFGYPSSERSVRRWRHQRPDPLPHSTFHGLVRAQPEAVLAWVRRQHAPADK